MRLMGKQIWLVSLTSLEREQVTGYFLQEMPLSELEAIVKILQGRVRIRD